jgi:glycosyltransferase involved in cell wall biosynthesis
MKILIDASNLTTGGGVQVAASLIYEFDRLTGEFDFLHETIIHASSEVNRNIIGKISNLRFEVVDQRPRLHFRRGTTESFSAVLTIFGPSFRNIKGDVNIIGFADRALLAKEPSLSVKHHAKRLLVRSALNRSQAIVIESPPLENELRGFGVSNVPIFVVPNATSRVFECMDRWDIETSIPRGDDRLLFFPARPYPHKNHVFLHGVATILDVEFGMRVKFVLTLTPTEMTDLGLADSPYFIPLGTLSISQLPAIYQQVDGVIFPSLLETYSAVPLEALSSGKPLFASDRAYVRQTARDAAWYFDPLDPRGAAEAIANGLIYRRDLTLARVRRGFQITSRLPSAQDRARAFLHILNKHIR